MNRILLSCFTFSLVWALSLNDVLNKAEASHIWMKLAKDYEANDLDVSLKKAAFFPTVTAYWSPSTSTLNTISKTHYSYEDIQVTMPLVNFPAVSNYQASQALALARKCDYLLTQEQYLFKTMQEYFNVLKYDKILKLSKKNQQMSAVFLQEVANKYEVGLVAKTDLLEAQAEQDQAQADIALSSYQLDVSLLELQKLISEPIDELKDLGIETVLDFDTNFTKRIGYRTKGYWSAQHQVEYAKKTLQSSLNSFLPTVYGFAEYNNEKISNTQYNTVGIKASWTVFDGGASLTAYGQKEKQYQSSVFNFHQASISEHNTLIQLKKRFHSLVRTAHAQRQALISARSALDSMNVSFEAGQRTTFDVLTAQNNLITREKLLYQAQYETCLAYIQLAQAWNTPKEVYLEALSPFLTIDWAVTVNDEEY